MFLTNISIKTGFWLKISSTGNNCSVFKRRSTIFSPCTVGRVPTLKSISLPLNFKRILPSCGLSFTSSFIVFVNTFTLAAREDCSFFGSFSYPVGMYRSPSFLNLIWTYFSCGSIWISEEPSRSALARILFTRLMIGAESGLSSSLISLMFTSSIPTSPSANISLSAEFDEAVDSSFL